MGLHRRFILTAVLVAGAPQLDRIRTQLTRDGVEIREKADLANQMQGSSSTSDQPMCPVCFCDIEDPVILQACGHTACRECLTGQVGADQAVPLRCAAEGCGREWVWRDVESLADRATLEKLMLGAFRGYLCSNQGTFGPCFGTDCDQIRRRDGSATFECDQCMVSYCVPCSEQLGQAVPIHEPTSCVDQQEAARLVSASAEFDVYAGSGACIVQYLTCVLACTQ